MDTTTYTAPELTEVGEFGTDTLGGFGDVYDFAGFYN
ncbi:lasso RiPP family leader peptide-containing protein [Saccharopolyspora cebuensis]|uniref:Lasso RiPP family leader peptide-containing protein n=1 Tax=Saccharopolyspora cebuensis TaxID=418759 RepID=A0ABV4CIK2_9PSEU